MSNFSIIRDAAQALREQLFGELTSVAGVDFGFSTITTDIVLSAPDSDVPNSARLSVYLYHVEPDPQLRNQPQLADGPDRLLRAPLALRCYFLITPLTDEEPTNHLILGRVMQALHDTPFIGEVAGAPIGDSFGGGSPELRLSIEPMTLEELSRVWYAMGRDYRLSVAYMMRTVIVDTALDPESTTRVGDTHVGVQPLVAP